MHLPREAALRCGGQAEGGAELVAPPRASPQPLRTAAAALRHRYDVVASTPRDTASVFDPIGRTIAQTTSASVLMHEIDLAYEIRHWREGSHEDTGVFWSNDPRHCIGSMIRELGLREMPEMIERMAVRGEPRRRGTAPTDE